MPRGRTPEGEHTLSNADRQARFRARREIDQPAPVVRYRRPVDRRSRLQRWNDLAAGLLALQAEYAARYDVLRIASATLPPPWPCRPSSISISMSSLPSCRRADMVAIDGHTARALPGHAGKPRLRCLVAGSNLQPSSPGGFPTPASKPRGPPASVVLTLCVSMTAAVGPAQRPPR